VSIGTLDAGSAQLTAAEDISADRVTTAAALTARAGGNATLGLSRAVARPTCARAAAFDRVGDHPGGVDVGRPSHRGCRARRRIAARPGRADGLDLRRALVSGAAGLTSAAGVAIGTLDAGSATIEATGALNADAIASRAGLTVTAAAARIGTLRVTGGSTRIAAGAGDLAVSDAAVAGDLEAVASGALDLGVLEAGGRLTATGATTSITTARVRGDAALRSIAGALRIGDVAIGGAATLASGGGLSADRLAVGGTLAVSAATDASLRQVEAGQDATLSAGGVLALGRPSRRRC
jgi:hypothetical protein